MLSTPLYRKTNKMKFSSRELIKQIYPAGTITIRKKASVPKTGADVSPTYQLAPHGQRQPKRGSIYPLSNDFSRAGKYLNNKRRDGAIVPSLLLLLNTIFPVRETRVNERVCTSARSFLSSYFLCTSSYTSTIALPGAGVMLLTITLTARLIRNAGRSS